MMGRKRDYPSDDEDEELHFRNSNSMRRNGTIRNSTLSTHEVLPFNYPTEGPPPSEGHPQLSSDVEDFVHGLVGSLDNSCVASSQISTTYSGNIKKPFECKFCGKPYQREAYLKKHLDTRQGFPDNVTCEQVKAQNQSNTAIEAVQLRNQIKQLTESFEKGISEKDNELKSVKAELAKFQNLYFLDKNGAPKLHHAVEHNDEHFVQELIVNGADVNAQNLNLETPLHRARVGLVTDLSTRIRIIDTLLRKGANPFAKDKWGNTFLHRMVALVTPTQFRELTACLLANNLGKLFDEPGGRDGATPLQLAVGEMEVTTGTLGALHKSGVNFNASDISHGQCLLAYAVKGKGSKILLSSIIQFGGNPKHLNLGKQNLLHIAAKWVHVEAMKLFLEGGIHINAVDMNGNTPFHLVMQCKTDKPDLVKSVQLLISVGASPNIRNKEMRTPLHMAALNVSNGQMLEVIKILLEGGKAAMKMKNVYAEDREHNTFVDYLVLKSPKLTAAQFTEIAEFLVGRGLGRLFGFRHKVSGETPLEISERNGWLKEKTVDLLAQFK